MTQLAFSIPTNHQIRLKDKIMIINSLNGHNHIFRDSEYKLLLDTLGIKMLKPGNYSITIDSSIAKLILHCLIKGVFINKEKTINRVYINETDSIPISVYLFMGNQCNLKCVYCYRDSSFSSEKGIKYNVDIVKARTVVKTIKDIGTKEIVFTGGEPLLVKEVYELGDYAKSLGLSTCILTNGTLITEQNIEKLKSFDVIKISLDSIIISENDITRGVGSTNNILRGIRLAKTAGFRVIVECVVSSINYNSIEDTITSLYNNENVNEVRLVYMIPEGRGKNNPYLLNEPYNEVQKRLCNIQINAMNDRYFDYLCKLVPSRNTLFKGCGAGIKELLVDLNGGTYPCRMFHYDEMYMGNLLYESLSQMHKKEQFQKFRTDIMIDNINDCKNCEIKYICAGGCRPSHKGYSGDLKINNEKWCSMLQESFEQILWLRENINPVTGEFLYLKE